MRFVSLERFAAKLFLFLLSQYLSSFLFSGIGFRLRLALGVPSFVCRPLSEFGGVGKTSVLASAEIMVIDLAIVGESFFVLVVVGAKL